MWSLFLDESGWQMWGIWEMWAKKSRLETRMNRFSIYAITISRTRIYQRWGSEQTWSSSYIVLDLRDRDWETENTAVLYPIPLIANVNISLAKNEKPSTLPGFKELWTCYLFLSLSLLSTSYFQLSMSFFSCMSMLRTSSFSSMLSLEQ
jgi:hypothetical protein